MEGSPHDIRFMKRAIQLAKRGMGKTSPNPMVGAVIVKDGRIIAEGYHKRFGEDHAEVDALKKVGFSAHGATMYVNLEPCSHYGKTPPCVDAIIRSGIKRVVMGMLDPNPLVSGRGALKLVRNGIEVKIGVMEDKCIRLNVSFVTLHTLGRPFVNLKIASTMDGKIATSKGESRWITSFPSRVTVHRMRASHDAIIVGIGTVLRDNPKLDVRHVKGKNPAVVVVDTSLKTPTNSKVLSGKRRVILVAGENPNPRRKEALQAQGAEILEVEEEAPGILNLRKALEELGKMGISSIMVEGGERIFSYLLGNGLCDKITLFLAPKLLGGAESKGFFSWGKPESIKEAIPLAINGVKTIGGDILIEAKITDIEKAYRERALCSQV